MSRFNTEYNTSGKHSERMNSGVLPRFLEARWESVSCKSDDELDQKVLSRSDNNDGGYMDYISI